MKEGLPAPCSLFGQAPPADACAVRLRLRLRRKGNPPAVTVHTLTEEALLQALYESEKVRAWVREADRARSYPVPAHRVFPGDLTWLDCDGRPLSHRVEVVFPYELRPSAPKQRGLCPHCASPKEIPMHPITSLVPATAPTIEPVPFLGGVLSALRSEGHGWLVLKPACEALGIDPEAQRKRLERMPWAVASVMEATGADGKRYQMYCLRSDRVAMWLATIDVSRILDEEARQRLALWQCHAAEALDRWWRGTPPPASAPEAIEQQITRLVGLLLPPLVEALRPRRAARPAPASPPEPDLYTVDDLLGALLRWAQLRGPLTFSATDLFAALSDGGEADLQLRSLWREFAIGPTESALHVGNTLRRLRRLRRPSLTRISLDTVRSRSAAGMTWQILPPQ